MTIKIEIMAQSFAGVNLPPEPKHCFIVKYDKDGNQIGNMQFEKPENITFDELYELNNYSAILDLIYIMSAQLGARRAGRSSQELVKELFQKNNVQAIKEWCGYEGPY